MGKIMEYECPNCGGGLEFNASKQILKCKFCEAEFSMDQIQASKEPDDNENKVQMNVEADDFGWDTKSGSHWDVDGLDGGIQVFSCQSCGGEIVGDATTSATKCPFCDSPIIVKGPLEGDKKPDFVIPFKLDKAAAKKIFEKNLLGKKLLPKLFKDKKRIEEIKGVYVPFWLFNTELDASILYETTQVTSWIDGDYEYTRTEYFDVVRDGSLAFENIPVDGSSKMPNELMESLEPYDFGEAVPFNPGYLAGYVADRYDVTPDDCFPTVNERVRTSTEASFESTVIGYDSVNMIRSNIQLRDGKVKYALYPVWMLTVTWENERYVFAINGQTGKFVGDLPHDKKAKNAMLFKWWGIFVAISVIIGTLIYLV